MVFQFSSDTYSVFHLLIPKENISIYIFHFEFFLQKNSTSLVSVAQSGWAAVPNNRLLRKRSTMLYLIMWLFSFSGNLMLNVNANTNNLFYSVNSPIHIIIWFGMFIIFGRLVLYIKICPPARVFETGIIFDEKSTLINNKL